MLSTFVSIALLLFLGGIGMVAVIRMGIWMSAVFGSLISEKPDITATVEILMMQ